MGQRGLADARHVLDQEVATGQQTGDRQANLVFLAEDDFIGRPDQAVESLRLHGAVCRCLGLSG